jgi:hypothetical protein
VIGQVISLGIGSPAAIDLFVLVGLSPNPEVRDAETITLVGYYGSLQLVGEYGDLALTAHYAPSLTLTGEV